MAGRQHKAVFIQGPFVLVYNNLNVAFFKKKTSLLFAWLNGIGIGIPTGWYSNPSFLLAFSGIRHNTTTHNQRILKLTLQEAVLAANLKGFVNICIYIQNSALIYCTNGSNI